MQKHQKMALALSGILLFASGAAFADTAPPVVVNPPDGTVAFLKKDRTACPPGTKVASGSPSDVLWCESNVVVPTPAAPTNTVSNAPAPVGSAGITSTTAAPAASAAAPTIMSHVGTQSTTTTNATIRSGVGVQAAPAGNATIRSGVGVPQAKSSNNGTKLVP